MPAPASAPDNRQAVQKPDGVSSAESSRVLSDRVTAFLSTDPAAIPKGPRPDGPQAGGGQGARGASPRASSASTEAETALTLLEDAGQKKMKRAIDKFGRTIRDGGVGLFYFSGHGMQVDGRNYLIPVDAQVDVEEDVEYESVEAGRVLAKMKAANNGMNLVILDACRNNPFARSFRSASKGLATLNAPSGTFIAYATSPGSVASDGTGDNGLYTGELVRHMKTPRLKIEEVFKRVRSGVQDKSDNKQVPWDASSLTGDFFFVSPEEKPEPAAVATPTPTPAPSSAASQFLADEELWKELKDSDSPEDFEDFLAAFPESKLAPVARIKLKRIKRKQERAQVNQQQPAVLRPKLETESIWTETITGMKFVKIPGKEYWMGKYEVTQGEWKRLMGSNPSENSFSNQHPVENLSWNQANEYSKHLTESSSSGYLFRLPNREEWNYACRAGTSNVFGTKDGLLRRDLANWGKEQCCGPDGSDGYEHTAPVGSYPPNSFGVHDMSGNVREFTAAPRGKKLLQGGSFSNSRPTQKCRISKLEVNAPEEQDPHSKGGDTGFRLVMEKRTTTGINDVQEQTTLYTKRQAYLDFLEVKGADSEEAYRQFIKKHSGTPGAQLYLQRARKELKEREDQISSRDQIKAAFNRAVRKNTVHAYQSFIKEYQNQTEGKFYVNNSKKNLKKLHGMGSTSTQSSSNSEYTKREAYLDFLEAKSSNSAEAFRVYLRKHSRTPGADRFIQRAKQQLKNLE